MQILVNLNNLALLYQTQGRYAEAEPLHKRSLKICEKALGPEHPDVATVLESMAKCWREIGKQDEAEKLEARAKKSDLSVKTPTANANYIYKGSPFKWIYRQSI